LGRPLLARPPCSICGSSIPALRRSQKYCSDKCSKIGFSQKRSVGSITIACKQCGFLFSVKQSRVVRQKYPVNFCSMKCRILNRHKKPDCICRECGEQKTPNDFYKDNQSPRGHVSRCKKCYSSRVKTVIRLTPNHRERSIRADARKRNLPYSLTRDQFVSFWKQPCSYCGDPIETIGLDRVDNSKGYSFDNVVSCCKVCNSMKSHLSVKDFVVKCDRIASRALGGM